MAKLPALILIGLLLAAGCVESSEPGPQDDGPNEVVQPSDPGEALTRLVTHLANGEYAVTADLVDEGHIGLLAAIEVNDADVLVDFYTSGISEQARVNFWSGFSASMPGLSGIADDDISITIDRQFATDGNRFALGFVRLGSEPVHGNFVLRLDGDRWVLDPIATFGGAFVTPIRAWLRVIPSEDFAQLSNIIRQDASSWRALGELQTLDDEAGIIITREIADLLIEIGS